MGLGKPDPRAMSETIEYMEHNEQALSQVGMVGWLTALDGAIESMNRDVHLMTVKKAVHARIVSDFIFLPSTHPRYLCGARFAAQSSMASVLSGDSCLFSSQVAEQLTLVMKEGETLDDVFEEWDSSGDGELSFECVPFLNPLQYLLSKNMSSFLYPIVDCALEVKLLFASLQYRFTF